MQGSNNSRDTVPLNVEITMWVKYCTETLHSGNIVPKMFYSKEAQIIAVNISS